MICFVVSKKKLNEICLELIPYQINSTVLEPELFIDPVKITIPAGFHEYFSLLVPNFLNNFPFFNRFAWYPFPNHMDQMIPLSYFMMNDLCGERLSVAEDVFQFLYCVRRSYRKNPYHNFEHAFNVIHSLYCMLSKHSNEFSILEVCRTLTSSNEKTGKVLASV